MVWLFAATAPLCASAIVWNSCRESFRAPPTAREDQLLGTEVFREHFVSTIVDMNSWNGRELRCENESSMAVSVCMCVRHCTWHAVGCAIFQRKNDISLWWFQNFVGFYCFIQSQNSHRRRLLRYQCFGAVCQQTRSETELYWMDSLTIGPMLCSHHQLMTYLSVVGPIATPSVKEVYLFSIPVHGMECFHSNLNYFSICAVSQMRPPSQK